MRQLELIPINSKLHFPLQICSFETDGKCFPVNYMNLSYNLVLLILLHDVTIVFYNTVKSYAKRMKIKP